MWFLYSYYFMRIGKLPRNRFIIKKFTVYAIFNTFKFIRIVFRIRLFVIVFKFEIILYKIIVSIDIVCEKWSEKNEILSLYYIINFLLFYRFFIKLDLTITVCQYVININYQYVTIHYLILGYFNCFKVNCNKWRFFSNIISNLLYLIISNIIIR